MSTESISDTLHMIQTKLKAPKGNFNSFGKYKYRSLEDILVAVKPWLPPGCTLNFSDELIMLGNRYYIKSTAMLCFAGSFQSSVAFAREPEAKKGYDEAQITGATTSYARKNALAGLLLCDDNPDEDAGGNDNSVPVAQAKKVDKTTEVAFITTEQAMNIVKLIKEAGYEEEQIKEHYKVQDWRNVTNVYYNKIINALEKKLSQKEKGTK